MISDGSMAVAQKYETFYIAIEKMLIFASYKIRELAKLPLWSIKILSESCL